MKQSCKHPRLEMDECDQAQGIDYYSCPDCGHEFEAVCVFAEPFAVDRDPWTNPTTEELVDRGVTR